MSDIRKIMALLLLLVIFFSVGLWVMSSLNLKYSQEELSDLRLRQLEEAFHANLNRINSHHSLIERDASQLAELGELFWRLHNRDAGTYDEMLEQALRAQLEQYSEALGGGIWFEPYAYAEDQRYFGLYATWNDGRPKLSWASVEDDYHNQRWYQITIPADWPRDQPRDKEYFWTLARYDENLEAVVITLATPMYDDQRRLIGVATIDWSMDAIVSLILHANITPNSFAFLLDAKDRKFTSLSREKALATQELVGALNYSAFTTRMREAASNDAPPSMQHIEMTIEGEQHGLFFAESHAGMVFGISVPTAELNAVIERMREANFQIAGAALFMLLIIAGVILYRVSAIMRLLDSLYTDRLTGLPSRNKLLQELQGKKGPDALVLLNIDSFKELNDFYGHECGDYILRELASAMERAFMPHGKLGPELVKGRLFRMPADEFALLLYSRRADESNLCTYLEKLCEFVASQSFFYAGQEISLTVTLGAALPGHQGKEQGDSATGTLLACANMALRMAKQEKRHFQLYDPSLHILKAYEHNLVWAGKLKQYIAEDRIVPHFQPIMNLHTGRIEKYECLIRIIDERKRVISPYEFLSVAKRLKLYQKTTQIMVEKSFKAMQHRSEEFSINLSFQDIASPETTDFIKAMLKQYRVGPRLIFEILESEGIDNYDQVYAFIREVKTLGCRIAIDDFGTGYSNFEYLLKLGADIVKIDGSLIKNLPTDPNSKIMAEGVVNFARKLGMSTVAEYIDRQEVLDQVRGLGVDYGQGFHIGKPAPIEVLPEVETVAG